MLNDHGASVTAHSLNPVPLVHIANKPVQLVGEGAKTGIEVKEKNHYLIYGLAPVKISDPTKMAGDAKDYTVTIQHTFVDGLLNALTGGIYTLTTTIVKK